MASSRSARLSKALIALSALSLSVESSASKALRAIAEAVGEKGHKLSHEGVAGVLRAAGVWRSAGEAPNRLKSSVEIRKNFSKGAENEHGPDRQRGTRGSA